MASPLEKGGLKEERYAENNIIISDLIIHNIQPPQLKKMYTWYKEESTSETTQRTNSQ